MSSRLAAVLGLGLLSLSAAGLTACGNAKQASPSAGHLIGASRCAENRAAGKITFLTGFEWSATVGTIDVSAAAANGWYSDMCLAVALQAGTGDPGVATRTVASGRTTIAEVGGASDALTAAAGGTPLKAIATYGNVPAITLITMATVTDLHQLEGRTLGYKGSMPPEITAMLVHLGVDTSKIKEVGVGYDPTVLPRGQVQALTGYKSNEVPTLQADGYKIRSWAPDAYGISGTFNTLVANDAFVAAHPSAVEDFLRATFHAYDWCHANLATCLSDESARSPAGQFDTKTEHERFSVESGLVDGHLLPGAGVGAESDAQFAPEEQLLYADKLISTEPDLSSLVDDRYVAAVESGRGVVWPAPGAS